MTAAVTGVLTALIEATNPEPPPIVPDVNELDARLTSNNATQRQEIKTLIQQELVPTLATLQGSNYNFDTAHIAKLQTPQALVTPAAVAFNSLDGSTPKELD